ncbi:MAG TPA: thioredoxin family protein [Desulfobacteraceae bacterium]|nr:thioredoxin family protein [Desulfobacteraceae bacterium]
MSDRKKSTPSQPEEFPASRTIRIGQASIGLIGLDLALYQAAVKKMAEDEAVAFLYAAISRNNYIPAAAREKYRRALRQAYRNYLHPDEQDGEHLVIRIFGKACVSCNVIRETVIEVLNRMELAADIEQIYDPDEIGRHGIVITPALVINGRLVSGGVVPTRAQIEQWIRELRPQ